MSVTDCPRTVCVRTTQSGGCATDHPSGELYVCQPAGTTADPVDPDRDDPDPDDPDDPDCEPAEPCDPDV
jgi:hypothetical protein